MADTAHRIGPMRRIKVTSRGVQDYYIPEYSFTAIVIRRITNLHMSHLVFLSWNSGEVFKVDTAYVVDVIRRIQSRTSWVFFVDQGLIYGAWYKSIRRMLQSQAMVSDSSRSLCTAYLSRMIRRIFLQLSRLFQLDSFCSNFRPKQLTFTNCLFITENYKSKRLSINSHIK